VILAVVYVRMIAMMMVVRAVVLARVVRVLLVNAASKYVYEHRDSSNGDEDE